MESITTIKLQKKTKERLNNLRIHRRETYDEILQRMLEILNTCRISPDKARNLLINLVKQRDFFQKD